MPNGYRRVKVGKPLFSEYGDFETGIKFNRPTKDRKYIKILALCLVYAPASLMYPNTKNPLMHEVRDMCRHGLLERYQRAGSKKYYYKTTKAGQDLLFKTIQK